MLERDGEGKLAYSFGFVEDRAAWSETGLSVGGRIDGHRVVRWSGMGSPRRGIGDGDRVSTSWIE